MTVKEFLISSINKEIEDQKPVDEKFKKDLVFSVNELTGSYNSGVELESLTKKKLDEWMNTKGFSKEEIKAKVAARAQRPAAPSTPIPGSSRVNAEPPPADEAGGAGDSDSA